MRIDSTNSVEKQTISWPIASAAQVVQAIDALQAGLWIATDADNTLWAGDVGDEVVRCAAAGTPSPWPAELADFDAYNRLMEDDYPRGCQHAAHLLAAVPWEQAVAQLRQGLLRQVRPRQWLVAALRRAIDRGVQVVIVSASPRPMVTLGMNLFGLDVCRVIAVDVDPSMPSRCLQPVPIGEGKVLAWQALGLPQPSLALGDSPWDFPLLASAQLGLLLSRACDDPTCDVEQLSSLPSPI